MAGTLVAQQILVGRAMLRSGDGSATRPRHRLSAVDLLTLSRGCAAGVLTGLAAARLRDRRGPAGWLGWSAMLYGAILCDWLDGPIARRLGSSEVGEILDLEADSWLTLCAALAAVVCGELPSAVVAPPLLRYALLAEALRDTPYRAVHVDEPPWVRRLGIMQMLVFMAALAPFGGRATRLAIRLSAPIQPPIQIAGLCALRHRRLGE
jgi:phosphatidylglycerophosphate synthase